MTIGEKIRRRREELELTQKEVAAYLEMNQPSYSKIEKGIQDLNTTQLRRVCEFLRLDPRYLLGLIEDTTVTPRDKRLLAEIKEIIERYS